MALVYKARDNLIIESRADLEQSIINNLSVFFDVLGAQLVYDIKLVFSITAQDGTIQKAQAQQVEVKNPATGKKTLKTISNRFAVMDVWLSLGRFSKRKLTRLLLGSVNIFAYNPTLNALGIENARVNDLIRAAGVLGAIAEAEAEPPKLTRGWYVIFTTQEGKIQAGPFPVQTTAQSFEDKILRKYKANRRRYSGRTVETDNPGLPIFQGIDDFGNTIFKRQAS